jgi:ferredoxin-like protein FixX
MDLDIINIIFIAIFTVEILSRFLAKKLKIYFSDVSNLLDIALIWICIANLFTRNDESVDFYFRRCFNGVAVAI